VANKTPEELLKRLYPPMLATLAEEPPLNESGWVYELKYDGFRALIAIAGGRLAMWSRNQIDLSGRFPRTAAALENLKAREVVLDGEIVALDEKGTPRFQLLQQSAREMIYVFDILWRDGEDLRHHTYDERRSILEEVLRRAPAGVRLSEQLEGPGAKALALAAADGREGIIAKRHTSVYESRRSREWLKIKAIREQEFVVVGWNPSTHSSKEIGSLHLAVNDEGGLRYAGKVGTGLTYKQRVGWKDALSQDVVTAPPVSDAPREKAATWVKPRYVVQVSFTEWTADNRLRHPSLLGIREDKGVDEVVRERPVAAENRVASAEVKGRSARRETAPAPATKPGARPGTAAGKDAKALSHRSPAAGPSSKLAATATPATVTLTHPERVLYPKDKLTKEDLARYYEAVSEPMMRALRDRPLALEHWNQGIAAPSWFHQHLGKEAPSWVTTVAAETRTSAKTVKHLVIDSHASLRWLAQMSVLTVHMWASHAGSLNEPDWVVFDLDPAKGKGIEQAIDAAIIMRGLLENLELPSFPKTSGKRGIHVFVPLAAGYSHEEANAFALSIATAVAREVPWITVERALNQRRGRLYLDCMQNAYGKTVVAPYSPRAIDGAPVSAPLRWEEVTKKLDPLKFNLRTMPNRLAKLGDLFAGVLETRAKLPELRP
jgi:bifunctional non-homologous end joining protein LigD